MCILFEFTFTKTCVITEPYDTPLCQLAATPPRVPVFVRSVAKAQDAILQVHLEYISKHVTHIHARARVEAGALCACGRYG
jgi:hypothetical protein